MAQPRGTAAYKKQNGIITITKDEKSVTWTPIMPPNSPPGVTFNVADITNLQQTPEGAPKVMLKIFVKEPSAAEAVAYMFHFNAPVEPRKEADAIKNALSGLLAAIKAGENSLVKENGSAGVSAAMAMAGASNSDPVSQNQTWYDDNQLKNDFALQQALMRKDPQLLRTYEEARRTKPDSITNTAFNAQFWSTRINLLRSFAVENNQQRGAYNVLSAVKPRQEDGEFRMRISREQIELIFRQHPLVKRVYDENVPKLNEKDFWSRFFLSRLFKKLKGERITDVDSTDMVFDRYLDSYTDDTLQRRLEKATIGPTINLEANAENQGGTKSGNRADWWDRDSQLSKAPVIRTLNSLSEKIMEHVQKSDEDPTGPRGMDERTFNELVLRDLQGDEEENRIMLNIKEQTEFFTSDKTQLSAEAAVYIKQDPNELIMELATDLNPELMDTDEAGGFNLTAAIGFDEDSDSEDEDQAKMPHVGSKSSLADAQNQVNEGINLRRSRYDDADERNALSGLSQAVFDRMTLTHATTTEFLHHFWTLFLSGDPDKAGELAKLVETLDRALDRINAVAADADQERNDTINSRKQEIRAIWEKTGKKLPFKPDSIGGGAKVVREMMGPTIVALDRASKEYRRALAAEGVDTT